MAAAKDFPAACQTLANRIGDHRAPPLGTGVSSLPPEVAFADWDGQSLLTRPPCSCCLS